MASKKIRLLIAKPGLDGHDRGAKVMAHALRDAGMEVIYSGLHQTVPSIVKMAIEDEITNEVEDEEEEKEEDEE